MVDDDTQKAVNGLRKDQQDQRDRITRLEAGLEYHSKSVDELKVSVKSIDTKLDDIKADINKAKGAAGLTDWVTKNWPGLGAIAVAVAAFFNSGGQPPP